MRSVKNDTNKRGSLSLPTWELLLRRTISQVVDSPMQHLESATDTNFIKKLVKSYLPDVPDGVRLKKISCCLQCVGSQLIPVNHHGEDVYSDDNMNTSWKVGESYVVKIHRPSPIPTRVGDTPWVVALGEDHSYNGYGCEEYDVAKLGIYQLEIHGDHSGTKKAKMLQYIPFPDFPNYFETSSTSGNPWKLNDEDKNIYSGEDNFQCRGRFIFEGENWRGVWRGSYFLKSNDHWYNVLNCERGDSGWYRMEAGFTRVSSEQVDRLGLNTLQ